MRVPNKSSRLLERMDNVAIPVTTVVPVTEVVPAIAVVPVTTMAPEPPKKNEQNLFLFLSISFAILAVITFFFGLLFKLDNTLQETYFLKLPWIIAAILVIISVILLVVYFTNDPKCDDDHWYCFHSALSAWFL